MHRYGIGLAYGADLECTKTTLGKEIKKLQFHGEILKDASLEKEYQTLQRLSESTVPSKLDLIENIMDKVQELMIDNDNSIQEVKDWNSEARESFKGTLEVLKMVSIYYNSTAMRRLGAPKPCCDRKEKN